MNILKQSTAATIKLGPFIDDGDGKSAETGLTISQADIRLSKNGGDIAQTHDATGATHDELGYYNVPLDATDTNTLGRLLVAVHESGALPVWKEFLVVTANVYDTLCSTDKLDVAVVEMATDVLAAAAVKADAVTKIQNGLATPTNITAGTIATVTTVTNGVTLADDAITASKFDESTAYPLKSADTGVTQVARVGADSDTLETLSDEIAAVKAETAAILVDTGTTLDGNITAILADTNEVQAELADGGRTDLLIDGIKAKTDNLPADPADDSDIDAQLAAIKAETAAILVDTGTTLDTKINTIDGIVDAIKLKTDLIPASPAQAGEYTAAIAAVQADLNNPDQYKADVSSLATSNEYDADFTQVVELLYSIMGGEAWTDETLVSIQAVIEAVKAKSDQLTFTTANKVDASATIDPTGLATSADLAVVDENVDAIKEKTDQMAFTVPNKIDASATVDPTGIATSEELEIIGEKVDDVLDKLNVSSVEFVTAVVGSTITILRGDTLTASLLNLGSMESYVSLDFTVKASTHQSDDAALIRVRKNASGLTDGLLRLNGAAHTTGTDGSITINDAPTGDITIMLKATVTDDLVPGTYVYDIQLIEAAEVTTLTTGSLIVSADVTRLVA